MENWWTKQNRIDGSKLEWTNHESDNSAIISTSIKEFEKTINSDRYNYAVPIGFCFNPIVFGNYSEPQVAIVCEDKDGTIFWFHIYRASAQHWIRLAGGTDEDMIP